MNTITLMYITFPSQPHAEECARKLLQNKYIACANIFLIDSMFWWDSRIMQEHGEFVLVAKTLPHLKYEVEKFIEADHEYQIPCILSWDVEANYAYFNWVKTQVV